MPSKQNCQENVKVQYVHLSMHHNFPLHTEMSATSLIKIHFLKTTFANTCITHDFMKIGRDVLFVNLRGRSKIACLWGN